MVGHKRQGTATNEDRDVEMVSKSSSNTGGTIRLDQTRMEFKKEERKCFI